MGKSVEYVDMSRFKDQSHDRNVNNVISLLFARHPELAQQKSTQALHDMLNTYAESITVISRVISDNSKAWVAAEEHLYSRMAEVTGLPKDELREKFKPSTIKGSGAFGAKGQEYFDALKDPNQPLAGAPTLEQQISEYTAIVDKLIGRKTQLWESVKHMNDLSPAFRAQIQLEALQQDSIKDGQFLEICHRMAGGLNDMLLKRAIESGNEEEVYSAIGVLATQYAQFVNEIYVNFAKKLGAEDGGLVLPYTVRMFQDRTGLHSLAPEIFQTLIARADEELRVAQERVMDLTGRNTPELEAAMRDFQIISAKVMFLEHMNPDQNRV